MAILWTVSNLTNCSANRETGETTAQNDTGATIKITANSGYGFYDENGYTFQYGRPSNMKTRNFTISSDKTVLTGKSPDPKNTTSIIVHDITATQPIAEKYTYIVNGTFTNCTCNKTTGEEVKSGDIIIISADNGYYFPNDIYDSLVINGTNYAYRISDDKTTLTFTVNETLSKNNIGIGDVTAVLKPTTTTSKFLNIYLPTDDELNLLASKRFIDIAQDKKFDYGDYILQLYRSYIPIPDKYIIDSTIILANSDTEISCKSLLNNVIDIETNIKVSGLLYDTDYTARLYIPNNDNYISIDINHIFNKTLTIKLSYELYSNKCQYSLIDDNIMFDCGTFTFGSNIPFRFYDSISQTDYNYNPPIKNTCYLLVVGDTITKISDINYEFINGDILDIDNNNINDNDYNEIVTLLNSGIYI